MSITSKAFRIALTAAALCAAGTGDADARARRVVVLDFDGPRVLADSGRNAVVAVLGDQYEVISTKRWEQARVSVSKTVHGPQSWKKAAKQSGVDAVIEGWVQDEGRHKVLTLAVRDATTGNEIDQLSFKISKTGLSDQTTTEIRTGLDDLLDWVEGVPTVKGKGLPQLDGKQTRVVLDAKNPLGPTSLDDSTPRAKEDDTSRDETARRRDDRDRDRDRSERTDDRTAATEPVEERTDKTERKPTTTAAATDPEAKENVELIDIFGKKSVEAEALLGKSPTHVPQPTPKYLIGAGGYYGNRSLVPESDGATQDYSARSKGFELAAAIYPWPLQKQDGVMSGLGFSFKLYHSAGSEVGADTEETVGNYAINQNGFQAALHYRQPLGIVSLDGEVGYGQDNYTLPSDFPEEVEVPDVQYSHLHAGGHLDLHVTDHATIGFGGSYLYILDNGDMSSLDWYGPGQASGFTLDANFQIPLPKQLYVRGELGYKRITTELDGAGIITEDETVLSITDAVMNGSVNVGIQF